MDDSDFYEDCMQEQPVHAALQRIRKLEQVNNIQLQSVYSAKSTTENNLYNAAVEMKLRRQFAEEQARNEADAACNSRKINQNSLTLQSVRVWNLIQEAVGEFEEQGQVSKEAFSAILSKLELFRELAADALTAPERSFTTVGSARSRIDTEGAFLDKAWDFISPAGAAAQPYELVSEFLRVLFSPSSADELGSFARENGLPVAYEGVLREFKSVKQDSLAYREKITPAKQEKVFQAVSKELTFNPKVSSWSSKLQEGKYKNLNERIDALLNYQKHTEEKVVELKKTQQKQELRECKFRPSITAYKPKDYHLCRPPKDNRSTSQKELDSCTFKPTLSKSVKNTKTSETPKGFKDSVIRMRNAMRAKEEERMHVEQTFSAGQNYENAKNAKFEPFSFMSRNRQKRDVLVYLEVKLPSSKKGRIAIHADDDPKELARNFSMAFMISKDAEESLTEMLREQQEIALNSCNSR